MKTIIEKNTLFGRAIGEQKYSPNGEYRFFAFVVKCEYRGKILLFNTLSRQLIALDKEEWNGITGNIKNSIFEQAVKDYFLVPKDFDDGKLKEQFISLMLLFDNPKGITRYTIYSTMDCNARCFYCYERGAKKYHMSDKTAEDVADYIIKNSLGQKVSIQWFGGEPLYNQNPIDIITDKLRNAGIEFKSKMVSNGYLFDGETVKKAAEKWNLKQVQITLDGTEEVYNRCKAYIYKTDESPFFRVLDNIEKLLKAGIGVTVRMNMDRHNKDDLYALVDILKERFGENGDLLYAYTHLLFDNFNLSNSVRPTDEKQSLTLEQMKIEEYIAECGFGTKAAPANKITLNYCMADDDRSTTVLPNGNLGKCEHFSDEGFWGSIYSDEKNDKIISEWKRLREPIELCTACPIQPQCKQIENCPNCAPCDEYVQAQKLSKLYRQMHNAYDKSCKD